MTIAHQQPKVSQKFTMPAPRSHVWSFKELFDEIHHHISEKTISKLLYIDLLQQALPAASHENTTLNALTNPLSSYFFEGSRAKTRHMNILLRFLQNTHNPKVLLQPTTHFQVVDCLEKIWQLAQNIQTSNALVSVHIKECAYAIIQEGIALSTILEAKKETSHIQQAVQWIEQTIEFANSYYSHCLNS